MPPPADDSLKEWRLAEASLQKLFVHDVKNPISAITSNLSFVDSMLVGGDEDLCMAVSDCLIAANTLLFMTNNLSLIARLEAGDHVEPFEVSVADLVRGCASRARELSQLSNTKIVEADPLPSVPVRCEKPYVELILENLILCSLQYAPSGGQVDVGVTSSGESVRVSVCDDGKPVDEEYRARLFERKFQYEAKSAAGARYARGLGLYAVGLAARSIGATIAAGATSEGRAEFTVLFPA